MAGDALNLGDTFLTGNPSGTPRSEIGGQALVEGVLMRSRTGYALALRRPDGRVEIAQVPFEPLARAEGWGRIPLLRALLAMVDMMAIGMRALEFSAARSEGARGIEELLPRSTREVLRDGRFLRLAATAAAMALALLVLLPNGIATTALLFGGPGGTLNESDQPVLHGTLAGAVRLLVIAGYVTMLQASFPIRRLFEYHGAEHQAVAVFEEGREVTVARALARETFHPRCGTSLAALFLVLSPPVFSIAGLLLQQFVSAFPYWHPSLRFVALCAAQSLVMPLVLALCFEILKAAAKHRTNPVVGALLAPGRALQTLTTRIPNPPQAETAILALEAAIDIDPEREDARFFVVSGLTDDESAPGYRQMPRGRRAGGAED
jgi:uncharacterized protein YqhQ